MFAYSITIGDLIKIYPEAVALATARGKKKGEDFGAEMFEIAEKYGIKLEKLGETNKDADLITGDLREEGLKVLNLNEEQRKREKHE